MSNYVNSRTDSSLLSIPNEILNPDIYNEPLIMHLELGNFKILQCPDKTIHNHKQCQFFHGPKDRRRTNTKYTSDLC